uniref:Uncharacterized protein n=1 Tax=Arundo donax TaxID=35708 RepID=A0A0A8ZQ65_ARUDO
MLKHCLGNLALVKLKQRVKLPFVSNQKTKHNVGREQ